MDPNLKVLFRIQDFAYRYSGTDPSTVVVHKMCQHNVLTAVKKSSCNIDYDFLELSGDNLLYKLRIESKSGPEVLFGSGKLNSEPYPQYRKESYVLVSLGF